LSPRLLRHSPQTHCCFRRSSSMASERGAANILRFNTERERKNLPLVENELQLCRKRKLQFKSASHLAAHLSDRLGIHRTTFRRNAKYLVLLAGYIGSQPGAVAVVDDETNDPYVLKAKLASAQAEVGMLRQKAKHLSAQLARATLLDVAVGTGRDDVDFGNLCMLLCLVLLRADTFAVDSKNCTLVDLAARPSERVVAGSERTAGFIRWMELNAALPLVKDIRKV
jgi:hypothetical protein